MLAGRSEASRPQSKRVAWNSVDWRKDSLCASAVPSVAALAAAAAFGHTEERAATMRREHADTEQGPAAVEAGCAG
jgi:hypothetical protein